MNHDFETSIRAPSPDKRRQWLKLAGYVALVVLVLWLSSLSPQGEKRAESTKIGGPVSADEFQSRDGRKASGADTDRVAPQKDRRGNASADVPSIERPKSSSARTDEIPDGTPVVRNVRLTNEDGRVVYRGDIDLAPTLDRIDRGVRLRFSHDGIVFENREKRLPIQPGGYYREYIHPTKGESGPGGQRIVEGRGGEVYYSPDHYRTFRRMR